MHRYVWKYYHGDIPPGYEIHHKDHNVDNNNIDNLVLLTKAEHMALHGEERTPEQRQRARELVDRIRPLTVAWHGSAEGHEWHKQHYEQMKQNLHVLRDFICVYCGTPFQSKKYGSKFCCNACKSAYRRAQGLDLIVKVCPICGKEYKTNKFKPAKTCGRQCAAALRQSKKCDQCGNG